jgi:hypothetical protein
MQFGRQFATVLCTSANSLILFVQMDQSINHNITRVFFFPTNFVFFSFTKKKFVHVIQKKLGKISQKHLQQKKLLEK